MGDGLKLEFKPAGVLLKARRLDGAAELFLANEVARSCDPYIPMQTGTLKNTKQIVQTANGTVLKYTQRYARKQYYSGRSPGSSHFGPLRGRYWFERAKTDHKSEWLRSTAAYTGGTAK